MKKIFIIAFLIFCVSSGGTFAQKQQKTRKISEMINDSQRTNGLLAGLLGGDSTVSDNAEMTILSAITYPNKVKVKYLDETQKLSKPRKKAVDKWLKDYNKTPDAKKFYTNETAVEEDGVRYWIIAHETAVIEKLKSSAKKDEEIILNLRILGYFRKGKTTEYFLLAESVN
ncbi:MAG TPA: hypothetical protein VNB22_07255 [Pyrinomonadaceae bacterium]|jgi:hypothetical protein|nr:hypothetical protein [Pyrinomonadaceae bacterium]